jgi:hypothetical protein
MLLLIAIVRLAHAQTLYGPGGLLIHPTALTPPQGQFGMNVSYYNQIIGTNTSTDWIPISLTYSISDRVEIGALFVDRRLGDYRTSEGGFARYRILADAPSHPAFAIAGSYLDGDVKQSSVSGVFSHVFRRGGHKLLVLHAGAQWARRSDIALPGDSLSGFLGAAVPLGDRFSLIAEAGTKFSFDRHETSAFGVSWQASKIVGISLGFVNTGRSKDNGFFAGVGYRFGGVDR